ncbi:hypothetical protein PYW07_012674 [Mythimna separata]|uniref:Protein artemis n=1 Tax=Mythimna separata TaxID=271217 RepID=A0AAD8DLH3_MYTSE|nr:hypothetical protein PYW07_012674 [Mythimna separata]
MRSAFNGYIDEIPFILVDNFENDLNKSAYFLSHYHADHVSGIAGELFRRKLKKNNVFIYASKVTVAIIREECPRLAPNLKSLELGKNTISITTEEKEEFLNVTTLPAGHSLGSVMYLFEYNKKNILYTGDFRISRNSVAKYNHLQYKGEPINVDVLYVDTTFQSVPSFPKRSDVVRNVVFHIKNWLDLNEKHRVILLTSAGYGYECVCNVIYDSLGIQTCVGESFWNIYSQFPKEIYGMTNDASSRIHLCTKYRYKADRSPLELQIYFSALKWGDKLNVEEEFLTFMDKRIEVCFATHCSREELLNFINYLKPKKIVGFPNEFESVSYLGVFQDGDLNEEPLEEFKISPKKRKVVKEGEVRVGKKVSAGVLKEAFEW